VRFAATALLLCAALTAETAAQTRYSTTGNQTGVAANSTTGTRVAQKGAVVMWESFLTPSVSPVEGSDMNESNDIHVQSESKNLFGKDTVNQVMDILDLRSVVTQEQDVVVKELIHDVMVVKEIDDEEEDDEEEEE
jgi:3-deoxy-D-arabino-heptulosonate 7-phosphate (DAHP) synthase